MKKCRKCLKIDPKTICTECIAAYRRMNHLRYMFQMTPEDYTNLLSKQLNLCAICKKEEKGISHRNNKIKRLSIDHCHKTGKIRGLLCDSCNRGLGFFRENIYIMAEAINYIKNSLL